MTSVLSAVECVVQDVRVALRALRRAPVLVAVAVLSLSLGIGATVAAFAVIDAIDLRGLPYPHAEQLVVLSEARAATTRPDAGESNPWPTSLATFDDWRQTARSYARMTGFATHSVMLWQGDQAEDFVPVEVGPDFFHLLGALPVLGRAITSDDTLPGAPPVVVLSFAMWRSQFGGDPHVIGKILTTSSAAALNSPRELFTVVGVMPPNFLFPSGAPAWVPMQHTGALLPRTARHLWTLARLRPGTSVQTAGQELNALTRHVASLYPDAFRGFQGARVEGLAEFIRESGLRDAPPGGAVQRRFLEFGIAGCVLLIAMLNVGTLLVARSTAREREMAVRSALGASRLRLVQHLLAEAVVIAIPSVAIGTLLADWGIAALGRVADIAPFGVQPTMDWRILVFAVGLAVFVAIGSGAIPALAMVFKPLASRLRRGFASATASRHHTRVHGTLLILQVASAFALAAGAATLGRELLRLETRGFGFDARHVVWFPVVNPSAPVRTPEAAWQFTQHVINELEGVAGVTSVSAVEMDLSVRGAVYPADDPQLATHPDFSSHLTLGVSPDMLRDLGIPLLKGRDFQPADFVGRTQVAMITDFTARRFWPGQNPIGKELVLGSAASSGSAPPAVSPAVRVRVIGVIPEVRFGWLLAPQTTTVLYPASSLGSPVRMAAGFLVRTAQDPTPLVPALVRHVTTIQGGVVPVRSVYGTTRRALGVQLREQRLTTYGIVGLAAVIVLLVGLGIHGLVAYSVSQRTRELAIRIAMGAQSSHVHLLVTRRPLLFAGIGLIVGGVGAWAVVAALRPLFNGGSAVQPLPMVVAAGLIMGVVMLATWLPMRRALRVDLASILRLD